MSARLAPDRLHYNHPFSLFEVCPDCEGHGKVRDTDNTLCARCDGDSGLLTVFASRDALRAYVAGPGWPPAKT